MPHFSNYSEYGRTLLIQFTCHRCGKQHVEPLEPHEKETADSYGHLYSLKPPQGWMDLLHGPLLCPECLKAYAVFMNNGKEPIA